MHGTCTDSWDSCRNYRIQHVKALLDFDLLKESLTADVALTLDILGNQTHVMLEAVDFEVASVSAPESDTALNFSVTRNHLIVQLPDPLDRNSPLCIRISYTVTPKAGMYFDTSDPSAPYICTLGEGGLAPNWLPVSADTDMKYSTEMVLRVPRGLSAVSNGMLVKTQTCDEDGRVSWHWRQDKPHPGYLVTLNIGKFDYHQLGTVDDISVGMWIPEGRTAEGKWTFRNVPKMVAFFQAYFGYPFVWDKYDHVIQPNFPTYAGMEHTSLTTFSRYALRGPDDAVDGEGPIFDHYHSVWTLETGIAHELVHHWFGNLVTCRNLGFIWLNEGFATYLMFLWTEEELGKDQFLWDLDYMRKAYFAYTSAHPSRPLEFHDFETPGDAFEVHHAYYKAGLVVHMLHRLLGDGDFKSGLNHYLTRNAFRSATSNDLRIALEDATGRDLGWFFDQWVMRAGHPKLSVRCTYFASRSLLRIEVKQTQEEAEGAPYVLPLNLRVTTETETRDLVLWLTERDSQTLVRCTSRPKLISVDPERCLLAEIDFPKSKSEWLYQSEHDSMPGCAEALLGLAKNYGNHQETLEAYSRTIRKGAFWPLVAEAASNIHLLPEPEALLLARYALSHHEYRVRKAALLGLSKIGSAGAIDIIHQAVAEDKHANVVGTAIYALTTTSAILPKAFFEAQARRNAWFETITLSVLRGITQRPAPDLLPLVKEFTSTGHLYWIREAAMLAWEAIDPDDADLHQCLIAWAGGPPPLSFIALEAISRLVPEAAESVLERLAGQSGDKTVSALAASAIAHMQSLNSTPVL